MITRRRFLQSLVAAPAIVHAANLMPIMPERKTLILYGDGIHDDSQALQAYFDGKRVITADGRPFDGMLAANTKYRVDSTLVMNNGRYLEGRGASTILTGSADPMIHMKDGRSVLKNLSPETTGTLGIRVDGYQPARCGAGMRTNPLRQAIRSAA